jgi:5-methylcytosine-specific restriction endonuclease McrA
MQNQNCVVLNGDFSFLNIIHWKRAVKLCFQGKAENLKSSDKVLRGGDGSVVMKRPLVIRLIKVIRMVYKNRVPYSKKNVMIRDGFKCMYCGTHSKRLTIDHVIPVSRGGKTNFENCVAACRPCNNWKGNKKPSEAEMFLNRQPYSPTISEFFMIKCKQLKIHEYLKELGIY